MLEHSFNKEYLKLRDSLYGKNDVERASLIVESCEKVICAYKHSEYLKIEWIGFVLYNLMPRNHYYKDEYRTLKEIFRASEEEGFAIENKRLRRLLRLNFRGE
jgi:hypothetical protein